MKKIAIGSALVVAALLLGANGAVAQTNTTQTDATLTPAEPGDLIYNEYIVSGFVAGSHNGSIEEAKVGYGGSFDYLRRGRVGFEFLADFSPQLDLQADAETDSLQVNNYMFNMIGATPLGEEGRWRPYVSGGIGAITLRSDIDGEFNLDSDQTEFGGNIGVGLMGFADRVGFRVDARYYRAGNVDGGHVDEAPAFWRSSAGLSLRW